MGSNQSKVSKETHQIQKKEISLEKNESVSSSDPNHHHSITTATMPKDSIHHNLSSTGGGCPMKKNDGSYAGGRGWFGGSNKKTSKTEDTKENDNSKNENVTTSNSSSGCPIVDKDQTNQGTEYNVYSQPIDPKNNMPSVANQLPAPFQTEKLSTQRVQSTIPKGSSEGSNNNTWTYPSPQMFYNSLARKNKLGDTTEEDIESVVAMHNNMNEKTWAKVIQWETTILGTKAGSESKLLKFMGRPSDLSPKAQFKHWFFGHPLPFDRHDWTVVREDGTEVRYVIDYYHDETRASESEESAMPALNDYDAVQSILVDVRPAIDDVQSVYGRAVTMPMARYFWKDTKFEPLPIIPTKELKTQISESQKVWANIQKDVHESKSKSMILKQEDIPEDQRNDNNDDVNNDTTLPQISEEEAKEVALSFAKMIEECQNAQKIVDSCKDEGECAKASLALTMCLAKVVCPLQQSAVVEVLNDDSNVDMNDEKAVAIYNSKFDKVLENMAICVNAKSAQAAVARQTHPHLFKDL